MRKLSESKCPKLGLFMCLAAPSCLAYIAFHAFLASLYVLGLPVSVSRNQSLLLMAYRGFQWD